MIYSKRTGIHNPFASKKASFDYQIVKDFGVFTVPYMDTDGSFRTYPQKDILIKSLHGESCISEELLVTLCLGDAEKELREGELISIRLSFNVEEGADGGLKQTVRGSDVYTLHDYLETCKDELLKRHE